MLRWTKDKPRQLQRQFIRLTYTIHTGSSNNDSRTWEPARCLIREAVCLRGLALKVWRTPGEPLVASPHWKAEAARFWLQRRIATAISQGTKVVKSSRSSLWSPYIQAATRRCPHLRKIFPAQILVGNALALLLRDSSRTWFWSKLTTKMNHRKSSLWKHLKQTQNAKNILSFRRKIGMLLFSKLQLPVSGQPSKTDME